MLVPSKAMIPGLVACYYSMAGAIPYESVSYTHLFPRHRPGQRSRNRANEDDITPSKSTLSSLPIPAKSSFRSTPPGSSSPSRPLDYRVAVGNMELFTTRFNYRVVFPPLKL